MRKRVDGKEKTDHVWVFHLSFFSFGTASALRGVTKRHLYYDGRNDGPLTLHLISELACVDVA